MIVSLLIHILKHILIEREKKRLDGRKPLLKSVSECKMKIIEILGSSM